MTQDQDSPSSNVTQEVEQPASRRNLFSFRVLKRFIRRSRTRLWFFMYVNGQRLGNFLPGAAIVITSLFAVFIVRYFPSTSYAAWHMTSSGQIGDTVGGLTAPFIGILNAVLLWWTLKVQNRYWRRSDIRFDIDRKIEFINSVIEKCELTTFRFGSRTDPGQTFKGLNAIYKTRQLIGTYPPHIGTQKVESMQWHVFLRRIQTILSTASTTLDQIQELHLENDKDQQLMDDLMDQIADVRVFIRSYIGFYDAHVHNQNFSHYMNGQMYHSLKRNIDALESQYNGLSGYEPFG